MGGRRSGGAGAENQGYLGYPAGFLDTFVKLDCDSGYPRGYLGYSVAVRVLCWFSCFWYPRNSEYTVSVCRLGIHSISMKTRNTQYQYEDSEYTVPLHTDKTPRVSGARLEMVKKEKTSIHSKKE